MLTVMASLASIVAVALEAPLFREICVEGSVEVMVPSVTVKLSAVSDRTSSVAVMVIVCVAPAEELASNVTVPLVSVQVSTLGRIGTQRSGPGHLVTSFDTAADNVTVNSASEPSPTFPLGPLMLISADVLVVTLFRASSALVIVGEGDDRTCDGEAHRRRPGDDDASHPLYHGVIGGRDGQAFPYRSTCPREW